jgi:hypothetical protein
MQLLGERERERENAIGEIKEEIFKKVNWAGHFNPAKRNP